MEVDGWMVQAEDESSGSEHESGRDSSEPPPTSAATKRKGSINVSDSYSPAKRLRNEPSSSQASSSTARTIPNVFGSNRSIGRDATLPSTSRVSPTLAKQLLSSTSARTSNHKNVLKPLQPLDTSRTQRKIPRTSAPEPGASLSRPASQPISKSRPTDISASVSISASQPSRNPPETIVISDDSDDDNVPIRSDPKGKSKANNLAHGPLQPPLSPQSRMPNAKDFIDLTLIDSDEDDGIILPSTSRNMGPPRLSKVGSTSIRKPLSASQAASSSKAAAGRSPGTPSSSPKKSASSAARRSNLGVSIVDISSDSDEPHALPNMTPTLIPISPSFIDGHVHITLPTSPQHLSFRSRPPSLASSPTHPIAGSIGPLATADSAMGEVGPIGNSSREASTIGHRSMSLASSPEPSITATTLAAEDKKVGTPPSSPVPLGGTEASTQEAISKFSPPASEDNPIETPSLARIVTEPDGVPSEDHVPTAPVNPQALAGRPPRRRAWSLNTRALSLLEPPPTTVDPPSNDRRSPIVDSESSKPLSGDTLVEATSPTSDISPPRPRTPLSLSPILDSVYGIFADTLRQFAANPDGPYDFDALPEPALDEDMAPVTDAIEENIEIPVSDPAPGSLMREATPSLKESPILRKPKFGSVRMEVISPIKPLELKPLADVPSYADPSGPRRARKRTNPKSRSKMRSKPKPRDAETSESAPARHLPVPQDDTPIASGSGTASGSVQDNSPTMPLLPLHVVRTENMNDLGSEDLTKSRIGPVRSTIPDNIDSTNTSNTRNGISWPRPSGQYTIVVTDNYGPEARRLRAAAASSKVSSSQATADLTGTSGPGPNVVATDSSPNDRSAALLLPDESTPLHRSSAPQEDIMPSASGSGAAGSSLEESSSTSLLLLRGSQLEQTDRPNGVAFELDVPMLSPVTNPVADGVPLNGTPPHLKHHGAQSDSLPDEQAVEELVGAPSPDDPYDPYFDPSLEERFLLVAHAQRFIQYKQQVLCRQWQAGIRDPEWRELFEAMIIAHTSEEAGAPAIHVVNDHDSDPCPPWEFHWTNLILRGDGVPPTRSHDLVGCDCDGPCDPNSETCACVQRQLHFADFDSKDGGFMYNDDGTLKRGDYPVIECNEQCFCDPKTCPNRVVGRGRRFKLNLEKTEKKGWGVVARQAIPMGTFVGIYAGEIITEKEAEARGHHYDRIGRTYLFDLDFHHLLDQVVPANDINNVPGLSLSASTDSSPREVGPSTPDPEAGGGTMETIYSVDAFHVGNHTRFLNHSCDPNCEIVPVYVHEPDIQKPMLGIFTKKPVRSGTELTFNYSPGSDDDDNAPGRIHEEAVHQKCECGAKKCRGFMF